MWEPRRLTTLWASTACNMSSFTLPVLLSKAWHNEDIWKGSWILTLHTSSRQFTWLRTQATDALRFLAVSSKLSTTFVILSSFLLLYNVLSLLDANCNLLGHRRHLSVCYTCLFPTPLVVVKISLLQCVLTLWCVVSERSLDLFSFRMLASNWLTDCY
jgi:hypothetical protein